MILPIVAYGHPILRTDCEEVDIKHPELGQSIQDMFETMYASNGVGLAAPQVNKNMRIFIIDSTRENLDEERAEKQTSGYKGAFINPEMILEEGEDVEMEEGCLSIPKIYGLVTRPSKIKISFYDENLVKKTMEADGFTARVIQHEYDHINGVLFLDHLKPLKKKLLKKRLDKIKDGEISPNYKMIFNKKRR